MKAPTKEMQQAASPDDVVAMLLEGNERFVNGERRERDLMEQVHATEGGQSPYAAILSCIDSRVTVEYVFDQPIGALFSARLAGNVVNEDVLGSLEYSCKVAGSKLVLVLGHTRCGAVMGACDGVRFGNLGVMLARIAPAVDAAMPEAPAEERNSSNADFVDQVVVGNVRLGVESIRQHSDVLRQLEEEGAIKIRGGVYDISTGKVAILED